MGNFFRGWDLLSGACYLITGWYLSEFLVMTVTFSLKELFTAGEIGKIVVPIAVCLFWYGRYRMLKRKYAKEEKSLDLDIKWKEMRNNREDMKDEINKFIKHSDNGSSISDRSHKI